MLSFSSCKIDGEEICGIWNAQLDKGKMQIEITPWKGKFLGYLLEFDNNGEIIKGSKTEDYIFITDLEFKDKIYNDGKVYLDFDSESYCKLTLELINKNQIKAIYDCNGQSSEEIWYRKGSISPEKKVEVSTVVNSKVKKDEAPEKTDSSKKVQNASLNINQEKIVPIKIEGETKKQKTFFVIGIQDVVKYDDLEAMEKSIEALWSKIYSNDFSSKLKNIIDPSNIYTTYSGYDTPKGKMSITLGYKVNDLSNIPSGLKGVKIPANEYLVYPMSGDKSDFEGEGWEQLEALMLNRKAESSDFEVYIFDNNYNIKKAEMWIATK